MHFNVCTLAFHLTVSILGSVLIGAAVLVLHSQGRQEDAEEYLGFTLNGLHEEMLALKKLISPQEESKHLSPLPYQNHVTRQIRSLQLEFD